MSNVKLLNILSEVEEERVRQDEKWGEQNHPFTGFSPDYATAVANAARNTCDEQFQKAEGTWQHILEEEVYEAMEQVAHGNSEAFRTELIQVAAVVVAMIECLDRKEVK